MTMLSGVTLSDHLVLEGLESAALAAASVMHTIGGHAVVQSDAVDPEVGVEIRLVGENHFSLQDILNVRALRGQAVQLIHHRGTFDVIVINTPDEPAIDYADPTPDVWYSGEITMITV